MLQRYTECLHLENGQDLEERERLLQEMTFLRMFMDIVRISVVTSSKVGNGDVLAFQSMLEGWNVFATIYMISQAFLSRNDRNLSSAG